MSYGFSDKRIVTIQGKDDNGYTRSAKVTPDSRLEADVYIQDQSTPVVDRFLTLQLGTATLAADLEFNDRTITLVAGHNFTDDDMIEIDDGDTKQYQSRVHAVDGNTITVTNPLCYAFDTTATVKRVTQDGNVD